MQGVRRDHSAMLLPHGMVLVVGGRADNGLLASAELYDPRSGTWTPTGNMSDGYGFYTATLLHDGTVLVVDGDVELTTAQLYDPRSGTWTPTGNMFQARCGPTNATLLRDGRVLLICGYAVAPEDIPASAQLYDPRSGTWTATASTLGKTTGSLTATTLASGKVLAVIEESYGLPSLAELYDPSSGSWTRTASPERVRSGNTATLLSDGMVLIAGGGNGNGALASAELYDPGS
jgi:hypothetical protein